VAIVGAGPAGSSTAIHLLAAAPELRGRVLLLERARFPRPKTCAGMVAGRGLDLIRRAGVELQVPMLPVEQLTLSIGGGRVSARAAALGAIASRADLDQALARAAVDRGATLREDCRVINVKLTNEPRLSLAEGGEVPCRVVVGADGVSGVVARAAGLPTESPCRAIEVITESVPADLPSDTIHFDFSQRDLVGYTWDFPALHGGRSRGVYAVRPAPGELRVRLRRHLNARGLELDRYRPRQLAQRPFDPLAPITRPNVLLVGEAAGVDIVTGEGIPQALAYGALAGGYLASALKRGDLRFDDWLERVRGARFGRRLRVLRASADLFHGPERGEMEQLIRTTPAILSLWARDFAGSPRAALDLIRGAGQLLPNLARRGPTVVRALRALLAPG
jgi:flavin-dependent dehydrogenase